MIKKLLSHPIIDAMCHKYQWLGKFMCKHNLNHSLVIKGFNPKTLKIIARCKYCGKEFKGEKV
jgi:hypothetical protein